MRLEFKKTLLVGTALVAISTFAAPAHAADQTLTGVGTWASAGTAGGTDVGDASDAAAGNNIDVDTNTLTITDDGTAIDGGAAGTYTLGAVTDTDTAAAGTGGVLITTTAGEAALAVTIGSAAVAGNFAITNVDGDNLDSATGVTGALTVGGALSLINLEATTAADLSLTVGGATMVTGATSITGGDVAGTSSTMNFDGNTAFTAAVTVLGGAHAGGTADLTLSGATNTFTGGLVLTDATGAATATVDGAVAQTVTGVISGDGDVLVTNTHASGVTFAGNSTNTGALTVNNDGNDQTVTITGDNAAAIALGDNVTADTITANFGGAVATAISGGITGGAAETVNVNVLGGSTVDQSAGAWTGIDTLAISGSTTLDSGADITATATTIASGSTLELTNASATALTSNVTMSGTLKVSAASTITGTITGASGTLDVDANTTVTGAIAGLTAIDIAAGSVLITGANVGATTTTLEGVGAGLTVAGAAVTVATNIVAGVAGEGDVVVLDNASTQAFTGNLGTAAATLDTLDVQGGAANVVTTTGNLYVDAITVNDADTLSFIGTGAQMVSGTITDGILSVGDGALSTAATFGGVIASAVSQNVMAAASATYNADATFTGAYTNAAGATTTVGVGSTVTADSLTDTGSYVLQANDADLALTAADFGSLADSGANGALTATNLTIDVTGAMTAGTVQLLTGINAGAATLVDNSIQYSFVTADNAANTDVTVAAATVASLATTPNSGVAATLDGLAASTNTQISAISDNLAAAATGDAFNEVLEAAAPTVDGGAVVASFDASVQSLDVNRTRLASLRSDETGMTAGNMGEGLTAWVQGFGKTSEQDTRDNINGYEADTYGVAFGIDTENLAEDAVVGVALSYANSDVDSKNATSTKSDIDSYQVSVYGDYDIDDATYLAGAIGYATNSIDQVRSNVGGISGLTANADYDSSQYLASAEVGRSYAVGGATVTPSAGVDYQHISIDNYTETGAGGANLSVDNDDLDILELGVDVEAKWDVQQSNGSHLVPAVHAGYRYDVIGDEIETTSNFTGGGAAFATNGADPAQGTANVGASLTLLSVENWNVTGAYDYEYKEDYSSHGGYIRAGFDF